MYNLKKSLIIMIAVLLLLFAGTTVLTSEDRSENRLALIGFENMEKNDQHNYLSSLISAVVREDLSHTEGITVLERNRMNEILKEQKMQISGLFDDRDAVEAGRLLGSDYLAGGSYLVMGAEVLIDITLIDVETGRVASFSNRGNSEDIIHLAAEKIARELTGERHIFRTADSDKPIIKSTLMPPGSLKLFSPLIGARIYIDDEFYGYTEGDGRIPIEIELPPGTHKVSTDLGRDFGVIIEPEILFRKWEQEFEIESDKTLVLEDPTRHFNDMLYQIQKILQENKSFSNPGGEPYGNQYDFQFRDRDGKGIGGSLTVYFTPTETGGLNAQVMLKYDYDRRVWDIECDQGDSVDFEKTVGLVDFKLSLDSRYINRSSASWSLWRNDVYQGLHRE